MSVADCEPRLLTASCTLESYQALDTHVIMSTANHPYLMVKPGMSITHWCQFFVHLYTSTTPTGKSLAPSSLYA